MNVSHPAPRQMGETPPPGGDSTGGATAFKEWVKKNPLIAAGIVTVIILAGWYFWQKSQKPKRRSGLSGRRKGRRKSTRSKSTATQSAAPRKKSRRMNGLGEVTQMIRAVDNLKGALGAPAPRNVRRKAV